MALNGATARLLLEESKRTPFSGAVLELGRQSTSFAFDELRLWAADMGINLSTQDSGAAGASRYVSDKTFLRALGFDEVFSCDVSNYEQPDFIFDLNLPVAEAVRNRFEVVINGGTLEHLFNLPSA